MRDDRERRIESPRVPGCDDDDEMAARAGSVIANPDVDRRVLLGPQDAGDDLDDQVRPARGVLEPVDESVKCIDE